MRARRRRHCHSVNFRKLHWSSTLHGVRIWGEVWPYTVVYDKALSSSAFTHGWIRPCFIWTTRHGNTIHDWYFYTKPFFTSGGY